MKDPYTYEGTNVLINKLNIKNGDELDRVETAFAIGSINKLRVDGFEINTIFDCFTIHKILFSRLYTWAGKPRTINMFKGEKILNGKSIDYVYSFYIDTALNELNNEFISVDWNKLDANNKTEKIRYFVSEFWHIHPFREGNTRTTAMFLYFLIKKANLHININFLLKNGKYFRNALVLSCVYSEVKENYLLNIIRDCVTFKDLDKNKYKTIDGFEVDKYEYTNHTIEKIETIKKPKDWMK